MRRVPRAGELTHLSVGTPSAPIPSATIVLLRDTTAGLEVLLLTRHDAASFGGASVFPGGKVDAADSADTWCDRCDGLASISVGEHAFYVAAIREAFEETGLLFARSDGNPNLLSCARNAEIVARYRADLLRGAITFAEIVARENLRLAGDTLLPYARWITPAIAPKRFDTFFFLAAAPSDCAPTVDGSESLQLDWLAPQTALAESETGARRVVFPTRATLSKLALDSSVATAFARAQRSGLVTVQPEITTGPDGAMICLPPEAGYPISKVPLAAVFDPRNYPNSETKTPTADTDGGKV